MRANRETTSPRLDDHSRMLSPAFLRLTIYRGCITLAYQILTVTAGWHIYAITHDVVALGLIGLAEVIPYFILSLFAGHAVDVLPKKLIAVVGCSCYAAIAALMVVMSSIDGAGLPLSSWIYIAMALAGTARSLLRPSYSAMMVRILERDQLAKATAIGTVVFQCSLVSGPVIGGLLIAWKDVSFAYGATGVFALTGLVGLLGLSVKEKPPQGERASVFASIREGLRFVMSTQVMLAAMALDMFAVLFGGAVGVLPAFIHEVLNGSPENLGLLRAMPAVGSVIVGLWLTRRSIDQHSGKWLMLSVAGFGLSIIGFGLSTSLVMAAVCLFLSGLFDGISVVLRQTILQLVTPPSMQGRVTAINGLFIGSSNEIGALESGIAANLLGLAPSIMFGGSMTLIIVAIAWLRAPQLRALHMRDLHRAL
jgi:MFS family permease